MYAMTKEELVAAVEAEGRAYGKPKGIGAERLCSFLLEKLASQENDIQSSSVRLSLRPDGNIKSCCL